MSTDMEVAHRRDMDAQRQLDDLRRQITDLLNAPPSRCGTRTLIALQLAVDCLREDSARIVRCWD